MQATVTGSKVKRVQLGRSSMGEPMLMHEDAMRILGQECEGMSVDRILSRTAAQLVGFRLKGLGAGVAYLSK